MDWISVALHVDLHSRYCALNAIQPGKAGKAVKETRESDLRALQVALDDADPQFRPMDKALP
jgi:hypothetical protein